MLEVVDFRSDKFHNNFSFALVIALVEASSGSLVELRGLHILLMREHKFVRHDAAGKEAKLCETL
jgi:hypothetical protein